MTTPPQPTETAPAANGAETVPLPRSQWVRAWSAADEEQVLSLANRLAERHAARSGGQPRTGLALLRLRESVMLDTFYLGEIPVASARVSLTGPAGGRVEGGASVMDDSAELAAALAVLDCVLAHKLPGFEEAEQLLRQGEAELKRAASIRAAMLARTRVDFSLMSAEAGDDDGA